MRWIVLAVALVGCGSTAAGERMVLDSTPPEAGVDMGITGAAGAGGAAGAAAGGSSGAAGAPVAPSCAIPESSITATAMTTQLAPEGSNCSVRSYPGPYYASVVSGQLEGVQLVTGVPWMLKNYSINPSGSQCAVTLEFTCAGCAGNYMTGTRGPCDAFAEVTLTVPPA